MAPVRSQKDKTLDRLRKDSRKALIDAKYEGRDPEDKTKSADGGSVVLGLGKALGNSLEDY